MRVCAKTRHGRTSLITIIDARKVGAGQTRVQGVLYLGFDRLKIMAQGTATPYQRSRPAIQEAPPTSLGKLRGGCPVSRHATRPQAPRVKKKTRFRSALDGQTNVTLEPRTLLPRVQKKKKKRKKQSEALTCFEGNQPPKSFFCFFVFVIFLERF